MKFLNKLKEVALSILPIVAICLAIHFFVYRFDTHVIVSFLIATIMVIIVEKLFF